MPESYESAINKKQKETDEEEEHLVGMPNYAGESPTTSDEEDLEEKFEDVENVVVNIPDFIKGEGGAGDVEQPGTRRPPDIPDISTELPQLTQQLAIDVDNLGDMGVDDLLRVIARVEIINLITQFDIADAVEPLRDVTVSGVNSIDTANVPEPVIPRADETSIPTRKLFIKASPDNKEKIWFGDDEVAPNSGFVLERGETIVYPIDFREQVLWMSSEESGQTVTLLGAI